jgi:hypothetical protein
MAHDDTGTATLSVPCRPELVNVVKTLAERDDRPMAYVIRKLIEREGKTLGLLPGEQRIEA